ncbi:DUF6518 family protein [Nocardiopsis eucommiae]|uniref:DUF6518 family protein n=1 Tax=Nocardiopsis eucommiae TaxID=2831970 RepID=UPI003D71CE66
MAGSPSGDPLETGADQDPGSCEPSGREAPPEEWPGIRHRWLLLTLALGAGFVCGSLAAFVNGLHPEDGGFLELSVGLYVVPPVLLGLLAARPGLATVTGLSVYLAAVLGHLMVSVTLVDDVNVLEYRAWVLVGLVVGPLLGFFGDRLRSGSTFARGFAGGLPLGLVAVFACLSFQVSSVSGRVGVHPVPVLVEALLTLLLLALCRGWKTRGTAVLCAAALVLPLAFGVAALFMLVWVASGDY